MRQPAAQASALTLWYDRATTAFEEALPLGNGRLGAMVFGDAASERVMLNDSTLWAGGPINPEVNPEAITFLPKVREALFKGDYKLADQLTKKLQGKYSQSYAPLGDLYIDASLPAGASAEAFRQAARHRDGDGADVVHRGRRCPSRATTSFRIPTACW